MGETARKERLEMRIKPTHKKLIVTAASLSGQSVTDFATGVLVERSAKVLEQFERTELSLRDRDIFLEVLDDEEPNEKLRAAAEKFLSDD